MALNINQRLNGLNPLAYIGENAVQPPDFVTKNRPPTINDSSNFALGDIWLDTTGYPSVLPTANSIYMLVALVGNRATWVQFGGVSSVTAGENLNNSGTGGNPVINLDRTIHWPDTNAAGTTGAIYLGAVCDANECIGGNTFLHNYGQGGTLSFNTFLGILSGNTVMFSAVPGEAASNTGIGYNTLQSLRTGYNNTALGVSSLSQVNSGFQNTGAGVHAGFAVTSGSRNDFYGNSSGANSNGVDGIKTGTNNTLIGFSAGSNYLDAESWNTIVGNTNPGRAGEIGVIRIGPLSTTLGNNSNIFIGVNAGNATYTLGTATGNVCTGSVSGLSLSSGAGNSLYGNAAGLNISTGSRNCGFGGNVFGNSLGDGLQSGSANCAYGNQSLARLVSGSNNLSLGDLSGGALAGAESNNIYLNNFGTALESNTLRVGAATGTGVKELNRAFIHGIRGVTPAGASPLPIVIDAAGQLGTGSGAGSFYTPNTAWTPLLAFGGTSAGITYSTQQGSYTRIGSLVVFTMQITLTNKGAAVGAATITGLPLNPISNTALPAVYYADVTYATGSPIVLLGSTGIFNILTQSSANTAPLILTNTAFTNNTTLIISGSYVTA